MEGTVGPEAQSVQGKENVMVSSQRADRYWKPGSRGTAGCRLAGREGLFEKVGQSKNIGWRRQLLFVLILR